VIEVFILAADIDVIHVLGLLSLQLSCFWK